MPEVEYSKRELDEKFKNLDILIREKHDDVMVKISEVVVQTTKTNGRVRWLEKMVYLAIGGLGILAILVLPLIFALIQAGRL
jgi:hypothetical protein